MTRNSHPISDWWLGPALARHHAAPSHHSNPRYVEYWHLLALSLSVILSPSLVAAQTTSAVQPTAVQPTAARATASSTPPALAPTLDGFLAQTRDLCGNTPQAERFIQALGVELASAPFTPPDAGETQVLTCDPDHGTLVLWLSNRELRLDVSDVPSAARARTLAVAFAETLRLPPEPISASERALHGTPLPLGAPPTPDRATNERAGANPAPTTPTTVHDDGHAPTRALRPIANAGFAIPISVGATVLGPEQTLAVGARIGVAVVVATALRLGAHGGYLTAHHQSALGQARLHAATLEATAEAIVWRPSPHSAVDLGTSVGAYRAHVVVTSAWGIDEPNKDAWFGLWGLHAGLSTVLNDELRVFTQLGGIKDLVGLRLRAGGERAMSFYGFGAQLRLGAAYAW